ncbi:DEAD/DEAH box helicase [Roseibacillus ishigakijimensis]|uniref:SNF2 helicase associated domain-containing protein n=1 Tax=Roseibacillus ishigakijimensis TaxID=454146 RepID=A0A934RS60_9BACT|nr:DEAD/DEAH box helicase [Roseibacillus ishigakijimensis]MBK1834942.1 SNF2 helicase associated domain-containing protein [Roseibacillus ishigakijimensis]
MSIELNDSVLMDMAGWKVMKEARGVWRAGVVKEASYRNGVLEGKVPGAGKAGKARLIIRSATDVDNECGCYAARKMGVVCAHVMAVALEVLEPQSKPVEQTEKKEVGPRISPDWPSWTVEEKEGARPVRLRVLLPVHLEKSWAAKQLMVGVEVEDLDAGETVMLAALKGEELLFVSESDAAVLEVLQSISPQEVPGIGFLPPPLFLDLLEGLGGHGRVSLGKKEALRVQVSNRPLPIRRLGDRVFADFTGGVPLLDGTRAWWFGPTDAKTARLWPIGAGIPEDLVRVWTVGLSLEMAGKHRAALDRFFDLSPVAEELPTVATPVIHLTLEGSLNHLAAELAFDYEESSRGKAFLRDEEGERTARRFLREWGFEKVRASYVLKDKDAIVRFHAYGREKVPADWVVREGERFRHAASQVVEVTPEMSFTSSGEDWFGVSLGYRSSNGNPLAAAEVRRIFQGGDGGQRTLPDGRVVVMEEAVAREMEALQRDLEGRQTGGGELRISAAQAGYLREAVKDGVLQAVGEEPWKEEEYEWDLGPGGEMLRSYQRAGVDWMLKLSSLGMGGILADDMGLGKTLQTLTFLYATGGQSLVVCPSSLVSNWVDEAAKFFPSMKVLAIEGPKRKKTLKEQGEEADVLVTSYALLRLDREGWQDWGFTTVILDEAQTIKNPEAKVSRAAFALSAEHRFALTGTPVENSVKDLWSIMNFVQPSYLGKRTDFAERYEKPLAKGDEPALRARLARRLRPLLLRRLKTEVATELPEKIEQVRYVELGKRQREVYEAILRESRQRVSDAEGGAKRMIALSALLRLRQACCDLRLTGLQEEEAGAKIALLEELLEEAVAGGHRVLVFSQFVQFLQAMVPMLAERGWKSCYLDGSTKNRGEVVKRFQQNDDIPVFLISLKAGGVGLNLTAADTVIHVDPWWNPAVEAQATDRAYRIGQERVVTSYKLIARGTVEEKILTLQEKKRTLISSLTEGEAGAAGISESEVLDILES